jgi:zinc transport system ATP-binding protein
MADAPCIAVEALTVRYGDRPAVSDLSFAVPAGAFMAIVGPNGSGKTTLVRTLLGLETPHAGTVRLFGRAPDAAPTDRIGYVPQVKTLDRQFPARAADLVQSALQRRWPWRPAAADRVQEALRRVDAADLAERPLDALSGGELQRVYLARALVRRPDLVLLDEPTTGVDATGTLDLYDLLEDYQDASGATVVMVTHDWNAAYHHADRVLVLDGTQVSFGPPREALQETHLRQAFGHVGHAHAMLAGGAPQHGDERPAAERGKPASAHAETSGEREPVEDPPAESEEAYE